ncbi:hypothetical protein SAMN04489760_14516 [Syntrophus gentianae]|uniref:Prenyltransferase and squalene oxidase repeat-containing protein n=1 Tax=Syntrophus gentianae TaxID=43775 RepID=A0A1H8B5G7_9BACT|nr:hypothetical protein [Syntrophus gentianae]SEM77067.1 hypothetical protein SAMN04489760_14516 [Syntrophus gentianae]
MEPEADKKCVKLRHNPLQIFKASKTPAGLYARKKWLGESDTSEWQDDFHETVLSLMNGQSDDGSWNQSPIESIRRLFGLHLTLRDRTGEIDQALDWLMKHTLNRNILNPAEPIELLAPDAFRELPFTTGGNRHFSLVCATLFLASIFQRGSESSVMTYYRLLSRWVAENTWDMDAWPDISNALRSLIVHSDFSGGLATAALVGHLGEIQDPSGRWPSQIPFLQTVNALAHLRLNVAHRQWVKALMILSNTQNVDGSWGDEDREWNTFLVVHALKNKACL